MGLSLMQEFAIKRTIKSIVNKKLVRVRGIMSLLTMEASIQTS